MRISENATCPKWCPPAVFIKQYTFIRVVPATSVVLLQDLWRRVCVKEVVHVVQLTPRQGVHQHLAGLVKVEVSRSQETQDVCILGDLVSRRQ